MGSPREPDRRDGRRSRGLTDRQRRFVELCVAPEGSEELNATRAAEAAGYAWPGKQGPRLSTFPAVADALWERFAALHPEAAAMFPRDWGKPGMHVVKC